MTRTQRFSLVGALSDGCSKKYAEIDKVFAQSGCLAPRTPNTPFEIMYLYTCISLLFHV